jgi:hypothetical protein
VESLVKVIDSHLLRRIAPVSTEGRPVACRKAPAITLSTLAAAILFSDFAYHLLRPIS